MEWLGFTTHHLSGIVAILSLIFIIKEHERINFEPTKKDIFYMVFLASVFVLAFYYAIYLRENPQEQIILF